MPNYKTITVTKHGSPDVLQVREKPLRPPSAGEVRIKILAVPVCRPDVESRYGQTPFAPKVPFVPGYAAVGVVDALGAGVDHVQVGDRVGALTVRDSYAEYLYWRADRLIPIPDTVDPVAAAPLLLNYIVAYQTLHRTARVQTGDTVLIIGASGGIGTAYLQLGMLAGLRMYGVASADKHAGLHEYGARLIDYRTHDFVKVIRRAEPDGIDAVFDGMGGDYTRRGLSVLRRGGVYVGYGNPLTYTRLIKLLGQLILVNLLPNGKQFKAYGTGASRYNWRPFAEDWAKLFALLQDGKINPVIAATYPILEAARANADLESGNITGNIVLVAPELL